MKKDIRKSLYEDFKHAFTKLLQKKPVDKITIKELVDASGYSRGTFYTYFSDVYELLEIIEEELLEQLGRFCQIDDDITFVLQNGGVSPDTYNWFKTCAKHRDIILPLLGPGGDPNFKLKLEKILAEQLWALNMFDDFPDDDRTKYFLQYQVGGILKMMEYYIRYHHTEPPDDLVHVQNGTRKYKLFTYNSADKQQRQRVESAIEAVMRKQRDNK